MVIRIGNSDTNNENQRNNGNIKKLSPSIWLTILVILFFLVLLVFSVANLPGRYKAIVVTEGGEVLMLDTVKGDIWCYRGNNDVAVITYQGKLKAGEKVPDRIVVKEQ